MISVGGESTQVDLDEAALAEMCDGDQEFACELLDTFVDCQDVAMVELAAAAQNQDYLALKKIAHFTKGGARSIVAPRLSAAAEALELAMNRDDHSKADRLVEEVRLAYADLKITLSRRARN